MRKLETVLITFLFLSMIFTGSPTKGEKVGPGRAIIDWKTQEVRASQESVEESTKNEEEHSGEVAEEEHQGSPPFMYFIQWTMLIAAFVLGLLYLRKVRIKGKPRHEGTGLAYALIVLVFIFFVLGYYPSVAEYHESGSVSLFKFLLLLITGILVTYYGVLGRYEEH